MANPDVPYVNSAEHMNLPKRTDFLARRWSHTLLIPALGGRGEFEVNLVYR